MTIALTAQNTRRIQALFASLLALAIPVALSQAAPPQAAPQQGQTTLQVQVPLVLEDVIVLDGQNQPIHNLKAADFTVTDNGQPVTAQSFEEHAALAPAEQAAAPKPPDLGVNAFTNQPTAAPSGALNILLLDALNTPMTDQIYLRQQLLKYLKAIPPGERIAIFGLGSQLHLLQGFTTDPKLLEAAIESNGGKVRASPVLTNPVSGAPGQQLSDAEFQFMNTDDANSIDVLLAMRQFEAEIQTYMTTQRVQFTLDALNDLARYLSALPGRKNLIWFSGSFPLFIVPDLTQNDPFRVAANYSDALRHTTDLLAHSQVAVYPVDARGLFNNPAGQASEAGPSANIPHSGVSARYAFNNATLGAVSTSNFDQQTSTEHLTMDQIASETGGKVFINTNDLAAAVQSAVSSGSNYYTLSYTPPNRKWDGKHHRIDVKVNHPGAHLSYRRGYFADDPQDEAHGRKSLLLPAMQAAMAHGAPAPSEMIFNLRVTPEDGTTDKSGDGGKPNAKLMKPPYRSLTLDTVIDIHNLEMAFNGSTYQGTIEFVALVYDADGEVVNAVTRVGHANLPAERYKQLVANGVGMRQTIDVPAKGDYFLRVGVHDPASNHVGAVEIPVGTLKSKQAMIPAATGGR